MFIVIVQDEEEIYNYEYSNIDHALEHYNSEITALLVEEIEGNHYIKYSK